MEELEKKIEEAANFKYTHVCENPPYSKYKEKAAIKGFISGALSEEAKEYHQRELLEVIDDLNRQISLISTGYPPVDYKLRKWLKKTDEILKNER